MHSSSSADTGDVLARHSGMWLVNEGPGLDSRSPHKVDFEINRFKTLNLYTGPSVLSLKTINREFVAAEMFNLKVSA